MRIKFTWGTGIVVFLFLFLAALLSFVVFAFHQDVNMVHKDYYEKGVDYTRQMEKNRRSAEFAPLLTITETGDSVILIFPRHLAATIESGSLLFFRPSNQNMDISYPLNFTDSVMRIPSGNLTPGRYIVKTTWRSGGMDYEVDKTVIIK